MSVDFVRPEVVEKAPVWRKVKDAAAGGDAVRSNSYILTVNPHDGSRENTLRNEQRLQRATYFNATGRTLRALVGIAFGKWPEVKLPTALDVLTSDADGAGVGLINQAQLVVNELLQTGRAGLLVDYPTAGRATSMADAANNSLRPVIGVYTADSIINWRTTRRGARNLLDLVVLKESFEEWDGFEQTIGTQYRVLRLNDGVYIQEVWRKAGGEFAICQTATPRNGTGVAWTEIPFTFIGATNNDAAPDSPPLLDLAEMNLAHYNNSADHEESLFFAGQAMYWISGADPEWVSAVKEQGLYVGSRAILPVPQGGQAGILQAQAVTGLSEEMKHKVELMAQLGARLMTPSEARRTATEAAGDEKTSNSVLSIVCDNVSDAYRRALAWCAQFARASGETDFSISTEFTGLQFDPQQLAQALAAVQAGRIPESDFWTYCRAIGLIAAEKSDDDVRAEIGQDGPALGDLTPPAATA